MDEKMEAGGMSNRQLSVVIELLKVITEVAPERLNDVLEKCCGILSE